MEYKRINNIQGDGIAYEVFSDGKKAAEFSCATTDMRFWIETVRLEAGFEDFQTMDAVLQFIQYKCWSAGFPSMYVRLNAKNLFYMELYERYGFRQIAGEESPMPRGGAMLKIVLKYSLPETREEIYRGYLRRRK